MYCARSIGKAEGRTSPAFVLPICPAGVDTTSICDGAMGDEACILLMIPLFSFCWVREEFPPPVIYNMLLVNN